MEGVKKEKNEYKEGIGWPKKKRLMNLLIIWLILDETIQSIFKHCAHAEYDLTEIQSKTLQSQMSLGAYFQASDMWHSSSNLLSHLTRE